MDESTPKAKKPKRPRCPTCGRPLPKPKEPKKPDPRQMTLDDFLGEK